MTRLPLNGLLASPGPQSCAALMRSVLWSLSGRSCSSVNNLDPIHPPRLLEAAVRLPASILPHRYVEGQGAPGAESRFDLMQIVGTV